MNTDKDTSIYCVVTQSEIDMVGFRRHGKSLLPKLKMCEILESARKFMASGLTNEQIKELDIKEPVIRSLCEHAFNEDNCETNDQEKPDLKESLEAINKEIHEVDLELAMLKIRKQALKRRAKAFHKQTDTE